MEKQLHFLQAITLSDSETVKALHDLLASKKSIVRSELAFVSTVLQPLYETIRALQKESGGILDVLAAFIGCGFPFNMVASSASAAQNQGNPEETTTGVAIRSSPSNEEFAS